MGAAELTGPVAFKLYDTYGLALDEQEEMARERGLVIDREGFEVEMKQQPERARASWKGGTQAVVAPAYKDLLAKGRTKFLGYAHLESTSTVRGLLIDRKPVDPIGPRITAERVLDQTPFYAETGGQVGDRGAIYSVETGEKLATVETVYPAMPGLSVHRIVSVGPIHIGDDLRAHVDDSLRFSTMRNHTATHL